MGASQVANRSKSKQAVIDAVKGATAPVVPSPAPVAPVAPIPPPPKIEAPAAPVKPPGTLSMADAVKAQAAPIANLYLNTARRLVVSTDTRVEVGVEALPILRDLSLSVADWGPSAFDTACAALADGYSATLAPHFGPVAAPRFEESVRTHLFIKACESIGIVSAPRLGWSRIVNHFLGAASDFDKASVTLTIKAGWAEWLKDNVPKNVSADGTANPAMTQDALKIAIYDHRAALNASDPKLYPKPKALPGAPAAPPATTTTAGPKPGSGPGGPPKTTTPPATTADPAQTIPMPTVAVKTTFAGMSAEDAKAAALDMLATNMVGAIAFYDAIAPSIVAYKAFMATVGKSA